MFFFNLDNFHVYFIILLWLITLKLSNFVLFTIYCSEDTGKIDQNSFSAFFVFFCGLNKNCLVIATVFTSKMAFSM